MKASKFPREFKAYDLDTQTMLSPKELIKKGVTLSPDGLPYYSKEPLFNIIMLWASGKIDRNGRMLFEGDICKMNVKNEFGSTSVDYGVMRWNNDMGCFILMMPKPYGGVVSEIVDAEYMGHELTNPELVPLVSHPTEDNG